MVYEWVAVEVGMIAELEDGELEFVVVFEVLVVAIDFVGDCDCCSIVSCDEAELSNCCPDDRIP